VKSFDYSAIAWLPEYHAARKALNDLAVALDRGKAEVPGGYSARLRAVREMAESTPLADCCSRCQGLGLADGHIYWPFRGDVKDGWLQDTYRCERGHVWTRGVELPRLC
jgi:hypothetical protein